jgi:hypothetical protein
MTIAANPNGRDIKREMFFSKENGLFALNQHVKFRKMGRLYIVLLPIFSISTKSPSPCVKIEYPLKIFQYRKYCIFKK